MNMSVLQAVKVQQLQARKDKNKNVASLLTTLIGECETLAKSKNIELSDTDVFNIMEKFIKNNIETMNALGPNNVQFDELKSENEIMKLFLPSKLTEQELIYEIQNIIDRNENINMGVIMKSLKEQFPNRYDGKTASTLVKSML